MLHTIVALTVANSLDILRRGGTAVLAVSGVAFVLSLRWFSAYGLGYEVVQLKELAVYTIGLLGAVAAVVFCLPGEDESEDAEALLLTRPVPQWLLALGTLLGRLVPLAALCVLWMLSTGAALLWFELEDPRLFHYQGAVGAWPETLSLAVPVFGQWLACAILLAFIQPVARLRRPILVGLAAALVYVLGYAVAGLGGVWGVILPDLGRHDLTAQLWGQAAEVSLLWLVIHACAWCAAGVALDSIGLRLKSAA